MYVDVACPYFQVPTRMYSGIMTLPTVPRSDIADFLDHELVAKVPRGLMGKSIFDMQSKLYRIVFRTFEVPRNIAGPRSSYLRAECDLSNAQVQLLMKWFASVGRPEDGQIGQLFKAYYEHRDETIGQLVQILAPVITPALERDHIKIFFLSAMAGKQMPAMLTSTGRVATRTMHDHRIVEARAYLTQAREAAVTFAKCVERIYPSACNDVMEYALIHNKDPVACILRRFSNYRERMCIDMAIYAVAGPDRVAQTYMAIPNSVTVTNSFQVDNGWPMRVGGAAILDNEHDGMSWIMKFDGNPEEAVVQWQRRLQDVCDYSGPSPGAQKRPCHRVYRVSSNKTPGSNFTTVFGRVWVKNPAKSTVFFESLHFCDS